MESGVRSVIVEANALSPRGWRKCRYEACRCQQEVLCAHVNRVGEFRNCMCMRESNDGRIQWDGHI